MPTSPIKKPRIVSVSSGKGGVGKTSFTVNLTLALASIGKRTLLIDGDLGLANVDVLLGLNVRRTIGDCFENGTDLAETLITLDNGLSILPATSGVPEMAGLSIEDQAFLEDRLTRLIRPFDFVIVDTAAGIGEPVLWFNRWAQENIVILSPDPTAMTDAYALIKVLNNRYGKNRFLMVINSVKSKKEGENVFDNMSKVLHRFLQLSPLPLGFLPQDSAVAGAIRSRKPFLLGAPDSRASRAIREIAARLTDKEL
jgi:flagellar biosynthesis protein FlhG